jgi:hypothetical protein
MPTGVPTIFCVVGRQAVACQLNIYVAVAMPDRGHVASAKVAVSTMLSSTGWRANFDRLMTFNTSAVAV